jgi:hypothetical protein
MTERILQNRLEPVVRRRQQVRFWSRLAVGWGAAALLALVVFLVQQAVGWASVLSLPLVAVLGGILAVAIALHGSRSGSGVRTAAAEVEKKHPDLDGLLLTAVQQQGRPDAPLGYLQRCLLRDAVAHSRTHEWPGAVPGSHIARAQLVHMGMLVLFLASLFLLRPPGNLLRSPILVRTSGVSVTPGDISLERGQSLVVLARFGSSLPAHAELVIGDTPATERRIALTRSLSDPVFGGTVADVSEPFTYRVEYDGRRTHDFRVTVFEYPRLERADAELTFPTYTQQEPRRIENTRRITAVEGTQLDLSLQLNKSVASATLAPRLTDQPAIPLTVATDRASAELADFTLLQKGSYELQLVDAEGRTNKVPVHFVFEVLPNRTPELRLLAPRGDVRPSALEEVRFNGTVWDDFGILAHGIGYTLVGEEAQVIELGQAVAAGERHPFDHVLRLEDLKVQPDQLVSWYVWADDIGPDGKVRRTTGDLLFAEIRPFEEIFREGSSSESQESAESAGGQPNETQELVRLQKQIVSATWKLQRDSGSVTPKYKEDVEVVRESQSLALERAEGRAEESGGPDSRALWDAVIEEMGKATVRLAEAGDSLASLPPALGAEQAAYQALLKLQARETEVTRSRNGRGQGGGGANQRQLDQLEFTRDEDRYETQRQAQAPSTPERREQLQVLNRLQELARRQEDLNERLQELQTALQEARTEAEREDLRRQLKRLQEEQQRMLADLDELEQRTQRPENQARMSELRRELEQTREEMLRAGEATREGEISQALAAGTRAQRQLQELRDELRQQNSSLFADDLRQMRADARELERQQQEIASEMNRPGNQQRRTLGEPDRDQRLGDRLSRQRERLTNLVERATQLSQAAETSEPLVSQHLYETLRQFSQDEARSLEELQQELIERGRITRGLYESLREMAASEEAKTLAATAELLGQGLNPEAADTANRTATNLESVRQGVERAAQSVLGDDTAALQLARNELDALAEQLEREINDATAQERSASAAASPNESQQQGGQRSANPDERGQPPGESSQAEGNNQTAGNASSQQQEGPGQSQDQRQTASRGASNQGPEGQAPNQPGGPQQAQGQPGQGQGQGQQPSAGEAGGQQPGGQQPGPGGSGQGGSQEQLAQSGNADATQQNRGRNAQGGRQQSGNARSGGGGGGPEFSIDDLLGGTRDGRGGPADGPITTDAFSTWSDRLREVEELIDMPELRDEVGTARERARLTRQEARRAQQKPDWAVVRLEILNPLVEVRRELDSELARRTSDNPLLPIDRDPVPNRFSELVQRYYEELGKDQ